VPCGVNSREGIFMQIKNLCVIACVLFFSGNGFAGAFWEGSSGVAPDTKMQSTIERLEVLPKPDKHIITLRKDDYTVYFAGTAKTDHLYYKNMYYLNNAIPDEISFFKETLDCIFKLSYGKQKFGHNAFKLYADLRAKGKWGLVGDYRNTAATEIKLNNVSLGEHDHKSSRAIPWFKDIWMQFSLNSVFGLDSSKVHYVKFGMFPFQLGRGISFGPFYGAVYEDLGLFSYYSDASAPGINISGEIMKDMLAYDLYYAKFEENSASSSAVFNTDKLHIVGHAPWRGCGKDDELWAARLRLNLSGERFGAFEAEPYMYYNEASDQKVEMKYDTKTKLGAYGLAMEYQKGNFECGSEVAFNYGSEKLRKIDRNYIKIAKYDDMEVLGEYYSHVVTAPNATIPLAPVDPSNKTVVDRAQNYENGVEIEASSGIYNASNRFRPAYTNRFDGWMGTIDAAYTFENINLKIAAEYIYASGDYNPHIKEENKHYHGFIGLHELYSGTRVKSAVISGERSIVIPESLPAGKTERSSNNGDNFRGKSNTTLTDLHVLGFSATWTPENLKHRKFSINPNVLFFWKEHESYKYEIDPTNADNNQTSSHHLADHFLGTEVNLYLNYELLKDLSMKGVLAIFMPGQFYKDVRGVPIGKDYIRDVLNKNGKTVNAADYTKYRLGTDNAIFGNIAVSYKF
jgi:hypothetical protein